jgi:uncharacterized membrane-anchored protein
MRTTLRKVPEVTLLFWVVKILSTAVGESASDYLVFTIDPVIAVLLGGLVLLVALAAQLAVRRHIAAVYWFAVVMVAVVGTMAADVLHIVLGVSYLASTVVFAGLLIVVFALWYATERTLSIHTIVTLRRELFYWTTVIATFALGTAAGDMTASTLGLGYLVSGILFALLFALVGIAHFAARLAAGRARPSGYAVLAFWLAYILTRPLGASFADWFGKAPSVGGLGGGDGPVTAVLAAMIVVLVAYLSFSRSDMRPASA